MKINTKAIIFLARNMKISTKAIIFSARNIKTSTKAIIFSALVFPGSGYFILKQKRRGFIALFATLALFLILLFETVYKAKILADILVKDILNTGQMNLNILDIQEKIEHVSGYFPSWFIELATLLLVAIWLVTLFDTYRLAKLSKT